MLKPAVLKMPQNINKISYKTPLSTTTLVGEGPLLAPPPTPSKLLTSTLLDTTSSSSSSSSSSATSPHFPDHLRCGEVFTWHCEGEFYAVECRLCDDHPLCPLSEFPLHMEAWHTDWSGKLTIDGEELEAEEDEEAEEEEHNDLYHVLALSPLNEDSGLCEYDHEHSSYDSSVSGGGSSSSHNSTKSCDDEENLLEPFEQVLIEQDNTVDTTQINDDEEEEMGEPIVGEAGDASSAAEPSPSEAASTPVIKDEVHSVRNKSKQKQLIKVTLSAPQKLTQTPTKLSSDSLERSSLLCAPGVAREERASRVARQINELPNSDQQLTLSLSLPSHTLTDDDHDGSNNNVTNLAVPGDGKVATCSWDVTKEESYLKDDKHEMLAGEIVQNPTTVQPDLQQFTSSSNFKETDPANYGGGDGANVSPRDLTSHLPNNVEITNVEIINGPLNIKPATRSKAKSPTSPRRKRKCQQSSEQTESSLPVTAALNSSPPQPIDYIPSIAEVSSDSALDSSNPQFGNKYIQCLDTKQSDTTETESIDEAYSSASSKAPKRRKTLSRACKKPSIVSEGDTSSSETVAPSSSSSVVSTVTSPSNVEDDPNSCEKASKIRCLVKQCERIAREHQQSSSSDTASVISKASTATRKKTRQRRSLTPVEVCDILPTIPLNDYTITYYDTENMSPESLSEHLESLACSLLDYDDFPDDDQSVASGPSSHDDVTDSSPSSPGSPKTEEEHFEFIEPKEKLNRIHVSELIELYKEHTRLWDQTHTEFCEPHLCRESWQDITSRWNLFCNRNFTITEVRIRISTLCQRYLKERERIQREGELDESAKFPYYEQMLFLEQHRSLQKRREIYEQQNEKILEIYRKYLVLWHVRCYKVRQVKERTKAFQSISDELKKIGIYLSSTGVQKRIRSLRKCYRLEKIRHLHSQVERLKFEPTFKHYERMQFLDKHIDPFVCRICGKIFESLVGFKEHVETVNHGNILEEEDEEEEQDEQPKVQESDAVVCGINEKFEISMGTKDGNTVSVFIKPLNVAEEVEIYTTETGCDSTLSKLPMEDDIIEKLMENVANESEFASKTLDKYLHSGDNTDDMSFYMETASVSLVDLIMTEKPEDKAAEVNVAGPAIVEAATTAVQEKKNEVIPKFEGKTKYTKTKAFGYDEEYHSGDGDTQSTRMNDDDIRCMISIYRKYRQLWDPNHLDYNSRTLRRQAWFALTTEYNKTVNRNFSWRSLYRKLIDYAKYYKKLSAEQQPPHEVKWVFYKDLMFLDDVIAVNTELQKSMHLRDITLKLIEIYKNLPQLWNIRDADFNKRPVKQRNMNVLCNRVQEETNMQINPERIKNRIIELRTAYRAAKKKRLKCLKTKQKFFPDCEFYEEFSFIDAHIDPFQCDLCCMDFKKLTDFNRHIRTEHEPKRRRFRNEPENTNNNNEDEVRNFENVCHICGIKFSNRGNLAHHLQRHEGTRNFECSMCPKKFFTSHSLKIHVRTHTKECPYICEKCGLSFVNASKLNQHVLRHTNKKDFKCDHCPKTFYTAFEKNRHTRWHLNIRDKNCPICGKSFVKGSSYYAHLMLHSDKKRFECDKCDTKFAQYAGLYKHKKRYHST